MKKRSQPKSLYKKEDDDFSFSRFLNTELSFKQLVIIFSVAFLVMFLILKNNMVLIFLLFILILLIFLFKFLWSFVKSFRPDKHGQINTFEEYDFKVNFQDSIDYYDDLEDDELFTLNDLSRNQNKWDKE